MSLTTQVLFHQKEFSGVLFQYEDGHVLFEYECGMISKEETLKAFQKLLQKMEKNEYYELEFEEEGQSGTYIWYHEGRVRFDMTRDCWRNNSSRLVLSSGLVLPVIRELVAKL
ncbi:hypothetical protein [Brazilian marseillevirus]|uniref:hypothetical protein n=1 Tax=Brazilian marseillevirus TaxID=1813599 RepID=UPI0007804659|nr:hypothetical protein A3303_gp005 [Brazilian marseillevirus]AMQ10513.1 hypothetical protein [Brazilian marseillevirus]